MTAFEKNTSEVASIPQVPPPPHTHMNFSLQFSFMGEGDQVNGVSEQVCKRLCNLKRHAESLIVSMKGTVERKGNQKEEIEEEQVHAPL